MITLRPDQNDMTARTQGAFRRVRRVLAQASCGWGKTTFGCNVSRKALDHGTRTLIIAHRRRLIQQWSERLEQFDVPHSIIMADMGEALERRHVNGSRVMIASKDTLISRKDREGLPDAGLVIIDETHNLMGPQFTSLIDHYAASFRLGLTATPIPGLAKHYDELVCAPPASAMIEAGVIVPFRVYAALELAEARKAGGKITPAGDPVQQWQRHAQGLPTVLFAPRVADSQAAVEAFNRAHIPAVHIDAHSSEAERDDAADGLQAGKVKVVCQVGLYVEGVDLPCVAVVQLLAKCGSLVKFIQAVWRAGRSFPGKTHAIVIDHTGAVFEHGFPDEDLEWTLTDGEPRKASERDGSPREPFVCVKCGLCYSGSTMCPGCGCAFAMNRKMYQPDLFAHLVEVDRDFTASTKSEGSQRHWTKLLYQFARMGKPVKAASAAFHRLTGKWPNEADVSPMPRREHNNYPIGDVWPNYLPRAKAERTDQSGMFA